MANTIKLGTDGNWAVKENNLLAYNDENNIFKPIDFDFTRDSGATRVNKDGLIEVVSNNEPRIDFKDSSKGALLLEPSRTNLITYSEDFSQTAWNFKSNINIQSGMLSPKGDLNAYKITATSTGNGYIGGFLNQSTGKYKSIWARTVSGTGKVNLLNVRTEGSTNGLFNLSEEWTRFEILHNGVDIFYGVDFRNSLSTLNEIIIYGAQLEEGSYATSYIPTDGSAVTRVADVCNNGGNEQVFNSIEGVLYWECSALSDDVGTTRVFSISDGSSTNSLYTGYNSISNLVQSQLLVNGVAQTNMTHFVSDRTEFIKVAVLYKNNNHKMYVNGVEVRVDTSGSVPSANTFDRLNFDLGQGSFDFYGNVKDIRIYNTALTDQELIALTSN